MNRVNQNEERELSLLIASMVSNGDFWTQSENVPSKIGFQRFGLQLREEDFEQRGTIYRGFLIRDRNETRKASSGFSLVRNEEKEFCIELDVWPFKCDELVVVVVPGLYVMIDGEQPEKSEDYSVCSRKFTRRYLLPKGCRSDSMTANYFNFVLMIRADKNGIVDEPRIPRKIDINFGDWNNDKPDLSSSDQRNASEIRKKHPEVPITDDILRSDVKAVKDATESSAEIGDLISKKMDEKATEPLQEALRAQRKAHMIREKKCRPLSGVSIVYKKAIKDEAGSSGEEI
ncbi:Alpha-crystallin A chain like protein [Argiope bruennichi]|uniref:Alpha-crystallin A chain like protein n=1 Tax=Argiope bruennichi TaxID=94029 RepID=A0A8T0EJX7_ARGBR|nr:Alpha-crystallin A chain like protein [Argiope bruennichi]